MNVNGKNHKAILLSHELKSGCETKVRRRVVGRRPKSTLNKGRNIYDICSGVRKWNNLNVNNM
jgi:hypothetical protein